MLYKGLPALSYIKSLDGLRALAVILVVFFHSPLHLFQIQFGWVGVNLFFILSGFLITRILINSRDQPFRIYGAYFYTRRFLRIFPLYYFYLVCVVLLLQLLHSFFLERDEMILQGLTDFRINYPFLITYTYNFEEVINFFRNVNYNNSMFFGHLWSLSVEEQFYLVWPLAIYFIPVRIIKIILLFIIFLIPFLRLLAVTLLKQRIPDLFWIGDVLYISTIFQLDTLSVGACLALFDLRAIVQWRKWLLPAVMFLACTIGVIHVVLFNRYEVPGGEGSLGYDAPVFHLLYKTPWYWLNNRYIYMIPVVNVFFGMLVLLAIKGHLLSAIFENKLLVGVGKVSYGIYIYHLGFSYLYQLIMTGLVHADIDKLPVVFQFIIMAMYLCLLYLLASASYRYFELRFLKLKSRY